MNKRTVATGFVLFSFLFPLKATAASFSGLYVFGDSLSDTGNTFKATGGNIPPSPPYFQGRFSNGLNWVDYLGQDLGLTPTTIVDVAGGANPTEGINFAFGGATTGTANTLSLTFPIPPLPALQQEIGLFTSLTPSADPDALYIVWAGANDYLPTQGSFMPLTEPTVPLNNLADAITVLAVAGAKNFLVVNLPDLGDTPVARIRNSVDPGTSTRLNALTAAHNSGLSTTLNDLSQILGEDVNITSLDVNSLFEQVIANPSDFGFTNVTDACLNLAAGEVCEKPNEYLFWDSQHPTTVGHQQIANLALAAVQPVPESSSALGILAFTALGVGWGYKHKHQKAYPVKGKF